MTTATYSVLQLALSKQLASNRENRDFVRKHPYSETAVSFWEEQVEETKRAMEETREIYEKSLYNNLVG